MIDLVIFRYGFTPYQAYFSHWFHGGLMTKICCLLTHMIKTKILKTRAHMNKILTIMSFPYFRYRINYGWLLKMEFWLFCNNSFVVFIRYSQNIQRHSAMSGDYLSRMSSHLMYWNSNLIFNPFNLNQLSEFIRYFN